MSQSQQYTKCQYGGETTYGTETSSYTELFKVQSVNFNSNNGLIQSRGLGEGFNVKNAYYGPFASTGSISQEVNDFTFLRHWIGAVSGSGTAISPYVLTEASRVAVNSSAGSLQPFSIEKMNDTEGDSTKSVEYAKGCVGTDFTLSAQIGQLLTFSGNFIIQKTGYRSTSETYTQASSDAYVMQGGSYKYGATPTALSGVQSFEISYINGLVSNRRSLDTRFIKMPLLGQRAYGIRVSIEMATSLASTIISDFYGDASNPYEPNEGSTSSGPTTSLEFKAELVSGSKRAYLQFDDFVIESISISDGLNGGLRILNFEGFAFSGLGNEPIQWWEV